MARLKAIHSQLRAESAEWFYKECKSKGVKYTREFCEKAKMPYLERLDKASATITVQGQPAESKAI